MSTERASNAHWNPDTKIARRNDEHQKGQCLSESHQGPVPRKMIKFNPGLSLTLSKVFLSKNMQLELTKYCWAFSPRYSNDNTKCYSK